MSKITGFERKEELPGKVLALYMGVMKLIVEGADVGNLKVSDITQAAGIGKGTAYEYFDSKEDIIVCAILYVIGDIHSEIKTRMESMDSFFDKIEFMLHITEEKMVERECFLRFVHLLTDTSLCGIRMQEKANQEGSERCDFTKLVREMLEQAMARGEIRTDLPIGYMAYTVGARIIAYMVSVGMVEERRMISMPEMKKYLMQEMKRELCPAKE